MARRNLSQELAQMRKHVKGALDALDAEKTPNYEDGHDLAVRHLLAALGKEPAPTPCRMVPVAELRASSASTDTRAEG